jgi:hypothetical protein
VENADADVSLQLNLARLPARSLARSLIRKKGRSVLAKKNLVSKKNEIYLNNL